MENKWISVSDGVGFRWTDDYADVSPCIELSAVFDDALKKDYTFTLYAVKVANEIQKCLNLGVKCTYGKWGARLETAKNPKKSRKELETAASKILTHKSWLALKESTSVFTFGE